MSESGSGDETGLKWLFQNNLNEIINKCKKKVLRILLSIDCVKLSNQIKFLLYWFIDMYYRWSIYFFMKWITID